MIMIVDIYTFTVFDWIINVDKCNVDVQFSIWKFHSAYPDDFTNRFIDKFF